MTRLKIRKNMLFNMSLLWNNGKRRANHQCGFITCSFLVFGAYDESREGSS